jgi:hypothetical protein
MLLDDDVMDNAGERAYDDVLSIGRILRNNDLLVMLGELEAHFTCRAVPSASIK